MNKWAALTFTIICSVVITTVFVMDIKGATLENKENIENTLTNISLEATEKRH